MPLTDWSNVNFPLCHYGNNGFDILMWSSCSGLISRLFRLVIYGGAYLNTVFMFIT